MRRPAFFLERLLVNKIFIAVAFVLSVAVSLADDANFKDRAAQESYAIGAQTGRTLRKDGMGID